MLIFVAFGGGDIRDGGGSGCFFTGFQNQGNETRAFGVMKCNEKMPWRKVMKVH